MYKRICARTSRAGGGGGGSDLQQQNGTETEDDFASLENELVKDLPRILPHLKVTAELLETRGALYEPVVKLMKCFQAYRPDMPYVQAVL